MANDVQRFSQTLTEAFQPTQELFQQRMQEGAQQRQLQQQSLLQQAEQQQQNLFLQRMQKDRQAFQTQEADDAEKAAAEAAAKKAKRDAALDFLNDPTRPQEAKMVVARDEFGLNLSSGSFDKPIPSQEIRDVFGLANKVASGEMSARDALIQGVNSLYGIAGGGDHIDRFEKLVEAAGTKKEKEKEKKEKKENVATLNILIKYNVDKHQEAIKGLPELVGDPKASKTLRDQAISYKAEADRLYEILLQQSGFAPPPPPELEKGDIEYVVKGYLAKNPTADIDVLALKISDDFAERGKEVEIEEILEAILDVQEAEGTGEGGFQPPAPPPSQAFRYPTPPTLSLPSALSEYFEFPGSMARALSPFGEDIKQPFPDLQKGLLKMFGNKTPPTSVDPRYGYFPPPQYYQR